MIVENCMTAAAVGPSHEVRSLLSKFESVQDPIILDYISSIPENLSDALNKVSSASSNDSGTAAATNLNLINRAKLQIFINKFHSEGKTLTSSVDESIKLLSHPAAKILVSIHQPNLFAYSGVFKKIVLTQTLKSMIEKQDPKKRMINLFLIVDHDFMDEFFIRSAQLPSIRNSEGILELKLPVSNSKRWQLVCNTARPGRTILDYWRRQLNSWIRNSSSSLYPPKSDKSLLLRNFGELWEQVECSYSKAKSYADFNSFFMSQIVNVIWGYDTLFVRLSEISSVLEDGFLYLISNFSKYSEALKRTENMFTHYGINTGVSPTLYQNAPLWIHCRCGSKASAKLYKNQQLLLSGICMSCKKNLHVSLGNHQEISIPKEALHDLSPRAIPILLLLSRDLGVTCYASGMGGSLGYTMVAVSVFRELSINIPLTLIWPSNDIYHGFGQTEALELLRVTKESDVITYKQILKQQDIHYKNKIKPLIEERTRQIKAGKPINALLSDLFSLKQEQRKIRQHIKLVDKVNNAINLKPCFIDYATNFGISDTEKLWRQNLLKNDKLASAVVMA